MDIGLLSCGLIAPLLHLLDNQELTPAIIIILLQRWLVKYKADNGKGGNLPGSGLPAPAIRVDRPHFLLVE